MLDSLSQQVQSITANTTITVAGPSSNGVDLIVFGAATASQLSTGVTLYAAAGNFASNLQSRLTNPGSTGSGGRLRIRNDSAFPQLITPAGADTLNGPSFVNPGTFVDMYCDGISSWYVVQPVSGGAAGGQGLTVQVPISSAQILALFGTSVQLVPAPGAGNVIIVDSWTNKMVTTATQYANGGVVGVQYDSTVNGAGVLAVTGTLAAALVNAAAATAFQQFGPTAVAVGTVVPVNKGIFLSNATAAFITGTGTMQVTLKYRILTP